MKRPGCIAGALSKGEYEAGLEAAGFEEVSVVFTHEVRDGIHGAIVKARKPSDPAAKGLPVIQPAASAGCLLNQVLTRTRSSPRRASSAALP